jgi:putative transposase
VATAVYDEWGISIRRACGALEFDRSTYHYKSRRREQAGLEARIKEICATRVWYGHRRVHVLLRREGWEINVKKTHRIYDELGLQLRNKTPKRRVSSTPMRTTFPCHKSATRRRSGQGSAVVRSPRKK